MGEVKKSREASATSRDETEKIRAHEREEAERQRRFKEADRQRRFEIEKMKLVASSSRQASRGVEGDDDVLESKIAKSLQPSWNGRG